MLGTDSKSIATVLRTLLAPCLVLTQNPRTLIQLVVQALQPTSLHSDPSLTAAFINASSLALLRASSFPMLGVVCAASVGRVKECHLDTESELDKFLLDPTHREAQQCDAIGCVAVMFGATSRAREGAEGMDEDREDLEGETVWSSFRGISLQSDYDAILRLAKAGARSVYNAMRDQLREEIEGTSWNADPLSKKMPKHKGGRVALNVGTEDTMDTT
jgi:exosome complex component RRP46